MANLSMKLSNLQSVIAGLLVVALNPGVVRDVHLALTELRIPAVLHACLPSELLTTITAIVQVRVCMQTCQEDTDCSPHDVPCNCRPAMRYTLSCWR